ncbi:calcium channel-like protein subunit Cch1, partial [Hortaea werneckii]
MDPSDHSHRRHQSTNSIPLQDLNTNGGAESHGSLGIDRNASHRRTLSDRGRALFRLGREGAEGSRRYAPIQERDSPPSPTRATRNRGRGSPLSPIAFVTSPSGQHERIPDADDEEEGVGSPVDDRGAFQSAIGFAGLSYNADSNSPSWNDRENGGYAEETPPRVNQGGGRPGRPSLALSTNTDDLVPVQLDDGPAFFSPGADDEEDRQPLTTNPNSRLRANTLAAPETPEGRRQDSNGVRSRTNSAISSLSVKFSPGHGRSKSRLGDDLRQLESGSAHHSPNSDFSRSPSSRNRSLSPAGSDHSPFRRTGTMLRKMSQRVVNVSNEPEILERSTQRRSSGTRNQPSRLPSISQSATEAQDFANLDGSSAPPRSPQSEKMPSPVLEENPSSPPEPDLPVIDRNPLRGNSLGLFSPQSRVRRNLLEFLVHPLFEPCILVLIIAQTVILAVDCAYSVYDHPRSDGWGGDWSDYVLFAIFCVYTIEVMIKMVVSGFILNPREYSTIDRNVGLRQALNSKANELFALHRKPSVRGSRVPAERDDGASPAAADVPPSLLRSFTVQTSEDVPGGSRQAQKKRLAYRAFLRHSFNRLDFVAVVSFWISFVMSVIGVEASSHVYVFRMLSCLRILRLLGITSGTSVILRSLKRAAPTLLNVAVLIGFFWLLFAIVGVQSFKSSLRRTCVWNWQSSVFPDLEEFNQNGIDGFQFCGGHLSSNGSLDPLPWIKGDGTPGVSSPKGYICPT